jgi:hypothetical protein
MLFNKLTEPDRTRTQLAYGAQFLPWEELNDGMEKLIVWRKYVKLYKSQIEANLTEDMSNLLYYTKQEHKSEFKILWKFNNIPTEIEWTRKSPGYILDVDFRIVNGIGPIALLSF